jgi:hypothetical protein
VRWTPTLAWIALAIVGASCAGFWGLLGVCFLYVLYYALLRPRVIVHVTPEHLREQAERDAITAAVLLHEAEKAKQRPTGWGAKSIHDEPAPSLGSYVDGAQWVCLCGTRNELRSLRCKRCNGFSPE